MELSKYIDYWAIFTQIKISHLDAYPKAEDFIDDWDEDTTFVKDLYRFLKNMDELDLEIDYEDKVNSEIALLLKNNLLRIAFVDEKDTSTEWAKGKDCTQYVVTIDLDLELFVDFKVYDLSY